ncbi:MAG: hypothetical protein NT123_02345 [Proteobacteria bacterium]|nr:hypothetical protein [Pseudomonadota bacterium]
MSEFDPKLSRAYREASTEGPPAAVDAAILAAARRQAAQSRRPARAPWLRWMAPASALATLVVAVALAFLVEREQPQTSEGTAIRAIPPLRPSAPPVRSFDPATEKAADSAAPAAAMKKETPAVTAPLPAPIAALAFPAESRAKSAESRMSAQKAAESESMRQSNVARDSAPGIAGASSPTAPAAAGKLAPLRPEASRRSPEAWLEEISRLQREGRGKEAAEQLAEFRKAYPAHAVPENLRGLQ